MAVVLVFEEFVEKVNKILFYTNHHIKCQILQVFGHVMHLIVRACSPKDGSSHNNK